MRNAGRTMNVAEIPEFPLSFTTPRDEFVDRERELSELLHYSGLVRIRRKINPVILGRRRIGKTAIIERLYNYLWNTQEEIVPLYFSFHGRQDKSYSDTLDILFREFIAQYIEFEHGDKIGKTVSPEDGLDFAKRVNDRGLIEALSNYFNAIESGAISSVPQVIATFPRTIADTNDSTMIVILDEFQVIIQMKDEGGEYADLCGIFQPAVESPRCAYFVTGSAVSLIKEKILEQGPLLGRFKRIHIGTLRQYFGLELVEKLATKLDLEMTDEQRAMVAEYSGSNAYYISCIMNALSLDNREPDIVTDDSVASAISREMTEGEIHTFLDEQIHGVESKYGRDIRVILGHISGLDNALGPEDLARSVDELREMGMIRQYDSERFYYILKDLAMADFVERNSVLTDFFLVRDPLLKRYLQIQYELTIKLRAAGSVVNDEKRKLMRKISDLKRMMGYLLESHVKYLMHGWDDRAIDGEVFGRPGENIKLNKLSEVYNTIIKAPRERTYEIDIFGDPFSSKKAPTWVVECRYRNRRANEKAIGKLAGAMEAVKKEKEVEKVRGWFISVGGFTEGSLSQAKKLGIFTSDKARMNHLFEMFGVRKLG